jgi:hypothetical protein
MNTRLPLSNPIMHTRRMLRYAPRFHKKNPKKIPPNFFHKQFPKQIFKKFQKQFFLFFLENQKTDLPKLLHM